MISKMNCHPDGSVPGFPATLHWTWSRVQFLIRIIGPFKESIPQRLKPNSLQSSYVRPKGRTLQRCTEVLPGNSLAQSTIVSRDRASKGRKPS
jgi:hypothetical protein